MNNKKFTILSNEFIDLVTKTARENIERDGFLETVLFVKCEDMNKSMIVPIRFDRPENEYKKQYITKLGNEIRKHTKKDIEEAVFISDTYYLPAKKNEDFKKIQYPISQNPERKEAIIILGRNNSNTKVIGQIKPYFRYNEKIIFEEPKTEPMKNTSGLLDFLFNPILAEQLQKSIYEENKIKN